MQIFIEFLIVWNGYLMAMLKVKKHFFRLILFIVTNEQTTYIKIVIRKNAKLRS